MEEKLIENPELLYYNPYINFLREFRLKRLDYELPVLYASAALAWSQMNKRERNKYAYRDVIRAVKQRKTNRRKLVGASTINQARRRRPRRTIAKRRPRAGIARPTTLRQRSTNRRRPPRRRMPRSGN